MVRCRSLSTSNDPLDLGPKDDPGPFVMQSSGISLLEYSLDVFDDAASCAPVLP